MTKDDRYWIKFKNNKFVVQKIIEGKQKQVAKFPTRSLAEKVRGQAQGRFSYG